MNFSLFRTCVIVYQRSYSLQFMEFSSAQTEKLEISSYTKKKWFVNKNGKEHYCVYFFRKQYM